MFLFNPDLENTMKEFNFWLEYASETDNRKVPLLETICKGKIIQLLTDARFLNDLI